MSRVLDRTRGFKCEARELTRCVDDNHFRLRSDGLFQFLEIDSPFSRRGCARPSVFRGAQGHVNDLAARHLDVADISGHRVFSASAISNARAYGDIPIFTYWSKKGSKMITSSPGSMKAMKALSMPSFAPVVIVISVSGFNLRPQKGE